MFAVLIDQDKTLVTEAMPFRGKLRRVLGLSLKKQSVDA